MNKTWITVGEILFPQFFKMASAFLLLKSGLPPNIGQDLEGSWFLRQWKAQAATMATLWGSEADVGGELPRPLRPEAFARKSAVGIGTSMGLGLLKNPGHPGTALLGIWAEPSREAFLGFAPGCTGDKFLGPLICLEVDFGGLPADWNFLRKRCDNIICISWDPSLMNNAPVRQNWMAILAICKVGLQGSPENIVIGSVLSILVACKYKMVNEDIVVASENGFVLRGDDRRCWVTTSSQLFQEDDNMWKNRNFTWSDIAYSCQQHCI